MPNPDYPNGIPKPEKKKKANKYNAKSCRCLSKHAPHRSRFEASVCNNLLADLQEGKIRSFRPEIKYELYSEGIHICNHYIDFEVVELNGSLRAVEAKGLKTAIWRIKMKLFQANYPHIPYEVRYLKK